MKTRNYTWVLWATALLITHSALGANPDVIGWWLLDEGEGNVAIDSSGNGNDGAIENLNNGLGAGGSAWVDDPERGMVLSFDGTGGSAYVRAGNIPRQTLVNDFTWVFWAKQKGPPTRPTMTLFSAIDALRTGPILCHVSSSSSHRPSLNGT